MNYTTHYNLNLPEGTDIVNPLVQDNPNYSAIDGALYDNKIRVVGNATEVKSGTVHAITRSDADIDVIRFTATGDWITSDTMTVDGSPVSVYLQDGTAPLTGAYVINTEVVAVINGSRVTLYGAQKLPGYTAADINYDNSLSGLPSVDVQGAIDDVQSNVDSVTTSLANLVKTATYTGTTNANGQVLNINIDLSHGILGVYDHNATLVLVPAYQAFGTKWGLQAYTAGTNTVASNAPVNATIYYI